MSLRVSAKKNVHSSGVKTPEETHFIDEAPTKQMAQAGHDWSVSHEGTVIPAFRRDSVVHGIDL